MVVYDNELTVLITWHPEKDQKRVDCFEENKRTIEAYNPGVEIRTLFSPFGNSEEAWLSSDLTAFHWYNETKGELRSERYLIVEWDCWCNINLKDYYQRVWDCNIVAPCLLYPERDGWAWFNTIWKLPERARPFATGVVPFCGILVSANAMDAICDEILKEEYRGINSELRFPTVATMLGYHPVPNPVCSRIITWKSLSSFDGVLKGLHHPRKVLY